MLLHAENILSIEICDHMSLIQLFTQAKWKKLLKME